MGIVVDRVTKKFFSRKNEEILALNEINLHVGDTEVVSIVGPSGCGKSTLLRIMAGFEAASSGRLEIDGGEASQKRNDVGVVFQQPTLFPWMTVWENITLGPRYRNIKPDVYRKDAADYIAAVGLTGFEKSFPYELSGGMKQRTQIARVLINKPRFLLMDEPFGALDFQTRLVMQELLLRLWQSYQPSLLFITHDVEEALFLSNRVVVMSGRPGSILEIIETPFGRPRNYRALTLQREFTTLKVRILDLLKVNQLDA
ncbi:MAG: ABC transporter ATP-binding protein [Candidimonas sp.]|nr:MAG: ABC transporter ATP-binding protein [Candidimonas sp.]